MTTFLHNLVIVADAMGFFVRQLVPLVATVVIVAGAGVMVVIAHGNRTAARFEGRQR